MPKIFYSSTFKVRKQQFKELGGRQNSSTEKNLENAKPSLKGYLLEADRSDISRYKMATTIKRCYL